MMDEKTVHLSDYRYGVLLADHGIGLSELSQDWPEVFQCPHVMRGYRDEWRRKGYAQPPR
jgi:hypothetical protein